MIQILKAIPGANGGTILVDRNSLVALGHNTNDYTELQEQLCCTEKQIRDIQNYIAAQ